MQEVGRDHTGKMRRHLPAWSRHGGNDPTCRSGAVWSAPRPCDQPEHLLPLVAGPKDVQPLAVAGSNDWPTQPAAANGPASATPAAVMAPTRSAALMSRPRRVEWTRWFPSTDWASFSRVSRLSKQRRFRRRKCSWYGAFVQLRQHQEECRRQDCEQQRDPVVGTNEEPVATEACDRCTTLLPRQQWSAHLPPEMDAVGLVSSTPQVLRSRPQPCLRRSTGS